MFEGLFQPMHLLVLLGLTLLMFGPKKIPELGKGLGDGIRSFKSAISGDDEKNLGSEQQLSFAAMDDKKTTDDSK
jgi:sec-independent protein translocase protein TatA